MRHALLIGSQTFGLKGVHNDLELMAHSLTANEFQLRVCKGETATRQRILSALESLLDVLKSEDMVIIYFAGHGARLVLNSEDQFSNQVVSFIVPTDMDQSSPGHFRGILYLEIQNYLAQIAARCAQAILIFDCCYAASLVRNARGRVRSLNKVWRNGLSQHLHDIKASYLQASKSLDCRQAIRLTAAGPHQPAYEDPDETRGGFFTEVVAEALLEIRHAPLTWRSLAAWVQEQVLLMEPRQRPEIYGPAEQLVFGKGADGIVHRGSRSPNRQASVFHFFHDDAAGGLPSIRGGLLHGIAKGNTYAIMDWGHGESGQRLGTVEVTETQSYVSRVTVRGEPPMDGSPLKPLRENYPCFPIAVTFPLNRELEESFNRSALVELQSDPKSRSLATIIQQGSALSITGPTGHTHYLPSSNPQRLIRHLESLAKIQLLRNLQHAGQALDDQAFHFEWGTVSDAQKAQSYGQESTELYEGDRVYALFKNTGLQDLYVNLFDIGITGKLTLLNQSCRSGYHLSPQERWCFGAHPLLGLRGVPLSWPKQVARSHPGLETLVAVISEQPVDMTPLLRNMPKHRQTPSPSELESMLTRRCFGRQRSQAQGHHGMRYAIREVQFDLLPGKRPQNAKS